MNELTPPTPTPIMFTPTESVTEILGRMHQQLKLTEERLEDFRKQNANLEKEKLESYWQGHATASNQIEKLKDELRKENYGLQCTAAIDNDAWKKAAAENAELRKELSECKKELETLSVIYADLRKERDHYEQVAQRNQNEIQPPKATGFYMSGHIDGFTEALAKVQEAVLKLRE